MPTMDEIRTLLSRPPAPARGLPSIASGTLTVPGGDLARYEIVKGWHLALAQACEDTWGAFEMRLLRFIKAQRLDPPKLRAMLERLHFDGFQWHASAPGAQGSREWFFVVAQGKPQAACLVDPHRRSPQGEGEVCCVEYLTAAPWNRDNPMGPPRFRGMDRLLMDAVGHHYAAGEMLEIEA